VHKYARKKIIKNISKKFPTKILKYRGLQTRKRIKTAMLYIFFFNNFLLFENFKSRGSFLRENFGGILMLYFFAILCKSAPKHVIIG